MVYIKRRIEDKISHILKRGKSLLFLGPRQTGKTTLVKEFIKPDISYSFARASERQRYESNPALLEMELEESLKKYKTPPLVFIDEVQKIPRIMDVAQDLIDSKKAQFILTGSSARKLKHGSELNLLPGRVVVANLAPLLYLELPDPKPSLDELLVYGSLPGIIAEPEDEDREADLYSYVTTYLEEEIRAESLVRNVGSFTRFLEIAAGESGRQLNFTRLSQDIGISDTTISSYYQILEDCLITTRIDPIIKSQTKRRLIKSPKYLFFDLGIRRACANEGVRLSQRAKSDLFEHFVGNELVYHSHLTSSQMHVRYWRDVGGPEVDFVLDIAHDYIPIEVKWSDKPSSSDARHLRKFLDEYKNARQAYIVCRTPRRYKLEEKITVIPWQEISSIVEQQN